MTEAKFIVSINVTPEAETVSKSDETIETDSLGGLVVKSQDEQRYTLSVAYPANRADIGRAQDGFRDAAGTRAVELAAWEYLTKSPHVGLWHQEGTQGSGRVCESYIYRGPDWTIKAADGSEQLIKAGDWLMGIIWEPNSWDLVKQGLIGGVSPQGSARRTSATPEFLAGLRPS